LIKLLQFLMLVFNLCPELHPFTSEWFGSLIYRFLAVLASLLFFLMVITNVSVCVSAALIASTKAALRIHSVGD